MASRATASGATASGATASGATASGATASRARLALEIHWSKCVRTPDSKKGGAKPKGEGHVGV